MTQLDIDLTIRINVSKSDGPVSAKSLSEQLTLSVSMLDNVLNATTLVALNQTFMRSLIPLQIIDPGCSCSGVENLETSNALFHLKLQKFVISALSGDIEKQFDQFISTILELFTGSFSPTIPIFLDAMVAGPARTSSNAYIAETINETKFCTVMNPAANSTIDIQVTTYVFSIAGFLCLVTVLAMFSVKAGLFEPRPKEVSESQKKNSQI